MIENMFNLPLFLTGPAIILSLVTFGLAGLLTVRRFVLPHLRIKIEDSEFSSALLQSVMVFYGLSVGLIAVNVFQTHSDVSSVASREATSLAGLYRDVSSYPEPDRTRLQAGLRVYTKQVIDEAWPQQRRGEIPHQGVALIDRFQTELARFEPGTEGQKILHAEAMSAYNKMIDARRSRLDAVKTALPTVMWIVILFGAAISLTAAFFFEVEDARLHGILVALLATFIGLVIFMVFAFDHPFRGDLGVTSEPYQLIYDQLMDK